MTDEQVNRFNDLAYKASQELKNAMGARWSAKPDEDSYRRRKVEAVRDLIEEMVALVFLEPKGVKR